MVIRWYKYNINYFNIEFARITILDSLVVMISACHSLLESIAEGQGSIPCQGESCLFAFCFSLVYINDGMTTSCTICAVECMGGSLVGWYYLGFWKM